MIILAIGISPTNVIVLKVWIGHVGPTFSSAGSVEQKEEVSRHLDFYAKPKTFRVTNRLYCHGQNYLKEGL